MRQYPEILKYLDGVGADKGVRVCRRLTIQGRSVGCTAGQGHYQ
jgi:hypothetical protein